MYYYIRQITADHIVSDITYVMGIAVVTLEGARKTPDAHHTAVMLRRVNAAAWSGCCTPVVMGYFNFEYVVLFGLF